MIHNQVRFSTTNMEHGIMGIVNYHHCGIAPPTPTVPLRFPTHTHWSVLTTSKMICQAYAPSEAHAFNTHTALKKNYVLEMDFV